MTPEVEVIGFDAWGEPGSGRPLRIASAKGSFINVAAYGRELCAELKGVWVHERGCGWLARTGKSLFGVRLRGNYLLVLNHVSKDSYEERSFGVLEDDTIYYRDEWKSRLEKAALVRGEPDVTRRAVIGVAALLLVKKLYDDQQAKRAQKEWEKQRDWEIEESRHRQKMILCPKCGAEMQLVRKRHTYALNPDPKASGPLAYYYKVYQCPVDKRERETGPYAGW